MLKSKRDVTVEYHHHIPVAERDPDEAYAELRETCPIAWSNEHGGYWMVTSYEGVEHVLKDHRAFSSTGNFAIPPWPGERFLPIDLDRPDHTAYRRAMNPRMSKVAIAELAPRLDHWTDFYIDRVIERGSCDLVYDIALPIPAAVTLEWVGWDDRTEWKRIAETYHDLSAWPDGHERVLRAYEGVAWFTSRIAEELAKRREHPTDDILTFVTQLEINGEVIPEADQINVFKVWVTGGVDTTTSLISLALVHLARHPEHRDRLIAEPELWPSATEEFLRVYPPARSTARTATERVVLGDVVIEPGDRVLAVIGSANHDKDAYSCPMDLDLDRGQSAAHMSFGSGIHRCVGLHLARQEFHVVARRVLERMPDYVVDEAAVKPYERQSDMQGLSVAPATFTPGPRVLDIPSDDPMLTYQAHA